VGTRMCPALRQWVRPSSSTSTQTARSRRVPRDCSCTPRAISIPFCAVCVVGCRRNSLLSFASRPMRLPHLWSSPDLSARSLPNWRTSAASRSGTGDEPTSANIVRKPVAKFSGSCIVRSSCTSVRMARPALRTHPPLLCLECDSKGLCSGPPPNFCQTGTNSTASTWERARERDTHPRCKRRPYLPRQPQAGASFACYSLEASRQKCVSMASLDLPHGSEPSVVMYRASEPRWSPNGVLLFGNERVCGLSDAATLAAGSMKNPAVSIWSNISLQVQGKVSMGIAGPHACRWVRFISG
jgi:hypothetical protein